MEKRPEGGQDTCGTQQERWKRTDRKPWTGRPDRNEVDNKDNKRRSKHRKPMYAVIKIDEWILEVDTVMEPGEL
ncbi:hypothetical protein RUM44_012170 [Polyplax serrata]|uniref:Uncharacterized protein n=1 Tax=Polyplax serrata TaxID=468196 RepID=A0ABR1BEZ0_POLSC